jgi:hypothetical protein
MKGKDVDGLSIRPFFYSIVGTITREKPDVKLETFWQVLYTPKLKIIVQMKEKKNQ